MGFNTTILILNDACHHIKDDKQFAKKLASAIDELSLGGPVNISAGNHCNAALAIESHHASAYSVIAVGGNTARVIGYTGLLDSDVEVLRELASQQGYRLVKKAKK